MFNSVAYLVQVLSSIAAVALAVFTVSVLLVFFTSAISGMLEDKHKKVVYWCAIISCAVLVFLPRAESFTEYSQCAYSKGCTARLNN